MRYVIFWIVKFVLRVTWKDSCRLEESFQDAFLTKHAYQHSQKFQNPRHKSTQSSNQSTSGSSLQPYPPFSQHPTSKSFRTKLKLRCRQRRFSSSASFSRLQNLRSLTCTIQFQALRPLPAYLHQVTSGCHLPASESISRGSTWRVLVLVLS